MKRILIGCGIILFSVFLFRMVIKEIKHLKNKSYDLNDEEYCITKSGDFESKLSSYAGFFAAIGLFVYGVIMIYFEIEKMYPNL